MHKGEGVVWKRGYVVNVGIKSVVGLSRGPAIFFQKSKNNVSKKWGDPGVSLCLNTVQPR